MFYILNANDEIIDQASIRENLSHAGEPGTRVEEHEFRKDILIGDKITGGVYSPVDNPNTERGRIRIKNQEKTDKKNAVRVKLISGQPLTAGEADFLLEGR